MRMSRGFTRHGEQRLVEPRYLHLETLDGYHIRRFVRNLRRILLRWFCAQTVQSPLGYEGRGKAGSLSRSFYRSSENWFGPYLCSGRRCNCCGRSLFYYRLVTIWIDVHSSQPCVCITPRPKSLLRRSTEIPLASDLRQTDPRYKPITLE